jgi:hypothetical protein
LSIKKSLSLAVRLSPTNRLGRMADCREPSGWQGGRQAPNTRLRACTPDSACSGECGPQPTNNSALGAHQCCSIGTVLCTKWLWQTMSRATGAVAGVTVDTCAAWQLGRTAGLRMGQGSGERVQRGHKLSQIVNREARPLLCLDPLPSMCGCAGKETAAEPTILPDWVAIFNETNPYQVKTS